MLRNPGSFYGRMPRDTAARIRCRAACERAPSDRGLNHPRPSRSVQARRALGQLPRDLPYPQSGSGNCDGDPDVVWDIVWWSTPSFKQQASRSGQERLISTLLPDGNPFNVERSPNGKAEGTRLSSEWYQEDTSHAYNTETTTWPKQVNRSATRCESHTRSEDQCVTSISSGCHIELNVSST